MYSEIALRLRRFRLPEAQVRVGLLTWQPNLSRDAMVVLGVLCGIAQVASIAPVGGDAAAYWLSGTSTDLYPEHWGGAPMAGWLFYPPATAQAFAVLQPLGWPLFCVVWTTLIFASMWYCAREWSLPLLALGLLSLVLPIPLIDTFLAYALIGNMQWPLAALCVLALRHPALWAVALVTKVGPAVGWWWHVFRREWGAAAIGATASVAVVGVSFLIAPDLWREFLAFAAGNATMADPPFPTFPVPFVVRAPTALLLVWYAARSDRAWLVPVACGWALPALYELGFLPFWVAGLVARQHVAELRSTSRATAVRLVTSPASAD